MDKLKEVLSNVGAALYNLSQRLPKSVRLMLRDALEGAAAAVAGIQLFVPTNETEARSLVVTVGVAVAAAVIAVVRRYLWNWFLDKVGPPDA